MLKHTSMRAWMLVLAVVSVIVPSVGLAHEPDFTDEFRRERCTFATVGSNPYFPLWPGYVLVLEGEEEDDGETVEISARMTILQETERVDGVLTRVVEEYETEDGELVEVSRNFMAICRETGDVWYFGEDVDDYEDGEIVGHGGAWRAGQNGAEPGIVMPGSPLIGARFLEEVAPGIALDRGEIIANDDTVQVPAGTFQDVLVIEETDQLDPESVGEKAYAPGVGIIRDEALELVAITPPPCQPDATTLCLNDGRFRVEADWETAQDAGVGNALLPSDDAGEFWFFSPDNTELIVKVLDACGLTNSFWVFVAGLTDVEVSITVTDTVSEQVRGYENPLSTPFQPVLDTAAFATCP